MLTSELVEKVVAADMDASTGTLSPEQEAFMDVAIKSKSLLKLTAVASATIVRALMAGEPNAAMGTTFALVWAGYAIAKAEAAEESKPKLAVVN